MPFTLAHPIAILPIWLVSRHRLHLPGLILGSMIPDLEYFLALQPAGTIGHTPLGILIQGIPAAIGLLLLIRYRLARPFLALLPPVAACRFPVLDRHDFWRTKHLAHLSVAIVTGAITHLFWDSFTHPTGWFVRHLPLLQTQIRSLPIYKILQYSSGILGLLALLIWFLIWFYPIKQQPIAGSLNWRSQMGAWVMILTIATLFSGIAIVGHAHPEDTSSAIIIRAVIGAISGFLIGLSGYAIGFWLSHAYRAG
jgi:Domain of unknown function (DUF4184)